MSQLISSYNIFCMILAKFIHRRPKLTKREVILFNIDANVQREKRDIFTADIYYLYNAKREHMVVLCYNGLNL